MQKVTINKRNLGILISLILLIVLCVSCGSGSSEKSEKASADWGRGIVLGESVVGTAGIAVDEAGELIHLVWPQDLGQGVSIHYEQLGKDGEPVLGEDFQFADQMRLTKLVPAPDGGVHLFWSSRQSGDRTWTLWHAILGSAGELIVQPQLISDPAENAGHYDVVGDSSGGALVVWGTGDLGRVILQRLNAGGALSGDPVIVTEQGESPAVDIDEQNRVHLSWMNGTRVVYGQANLANIGQIDVSDVSDVTLGTGDALYGPVLGYADGWVYAFWSILKQSGTEAGTASTEYVSFLADQPMFSNSNRVIISPAEEQDYIPFNNGIQLSRLIVPPNVPWAAADYILHPAVMIGRAGKVGVALTTSQLYRADEHLQIVMAVFSDGALAGYSFVGKTQGISDDPVLSADDAGNLYIAWREGSAGQKMYFTSTAPDILKRLDRIEGGDILNAVLTGGMESFVSITLMPVIGFGWLLPGLAIMGLWKAFRDEEKIGDPVSMLVLAIAILVFQFVKFVTLPTIVTYIPFSAWLFIPKFLEMPLRVGVPLIILGISILVANWVRVKRSNSAALFFFVMAVTDSLLSLAIYGVNFLGVY